MADAGKKLDRSVYIGDLGVGPLFATPARKTPQTTLPPGYDPMAPEDSYRRCVPEDHRKRLGQFFTPEPIASFMCSWVLACNPSRILDPAVGPGIFVREVLKHTTTCQISAIDVDSLALTAARLATRGASSVQWIQTDFLTWGSEKQFDGILANPPYLKHHNFAYRGNIFSEIGRRNHVKVSRLTNIYALFILEICRRLKSGGRAAIIVPGEWVNANFGVPLKKYLLSNGLLNVLIYFSHYSTLFPSALTTASVLLLEKARRNQACSPVLTSYVTGPVNIASLNPLLQERFPECEGVRTQRMSAQLLLKEKKWDYVLGHGCQQVLKGFVPLSALAETRRGIATGANKYFHVSAETVANYNIRQDSVLKCVGRAVDVPSFIFRESDFQSLVRKGKRVYLLNFQDNLSSAEQRYIAKGEAQGLPERYLLAARKPWYAMERRTPSPIWATVFARKALRFVVNAANLHNLTAFHCIYPTLTDPLFVKALVASLNSRKLRELAKWHRRVYGGGLSKFEPRDLLDIQVPDLRAVTRATLQRLADGLDRLETTAREKDTDLEEAFASLDKLVDEAAEEAGTIAGSGRERELSHQ